MKKLIATLALVGLLSACGREATVNGKTYGTCGAISMATDDDCKENAVVKYKPCWGNIIWGAVLIETVVAPIYFFGFSMFNPVPK
jgi:hypothetical protein